MSHTAPQVMSFKDYIMQSWYYTSTCSNWINNDLYQIINNIQEYHFISQYMIDIHFNSFIISFKIRFWSKLLNKMTLISSTNSSLKCDIQLCYCVLSDISKRYFRILISLWFKSYHRYHYIDIRSFVINEFFF